MNCPYCGQIHPDDARFCPTTGRPVQGDLICPHCGQSIEVDWQICAHCGKRISTPDTINEIRSYLNRVLPSSLSRQPNMLLIALVGIVGFCIISAICLVFVTRIPKLVSQSTKSTPDNYGVYLQSGSGLIEMHPFEGNPERDQVSSINSTTSSQPTVIVWDPNLIWQYVFLVSDYGKGQEIPYEISPQGDGVLELTPRVELYPGVYCLIQTDPLGVSYFFPNWCFRVR